MFLNFKQKTSPVMHPLIKYSIAVIAGLLIVYFSLDIRKTDEMKDTAAGFDVNSYVTKLWEQDLPAVLEQAVDVDELIMLLQSEPTKALNTYGHKLGISNTWYLLCKGSGKIESADDENLIVVLEDGKKVLLAIDFIFGNAVRDGSGLVNIDDFLNMTDFNNVSVALNKLIKERVAADLKNQAKPGMRILFSGATEISEKNTDASAIRVIPVSVSLSPAKNE
jgi:predicted lipoprotein